MSPVQSIKESGSSAVMASSRSTQDSYRTTLISMEQKELLTHVLMIRDSSWLISAWKAKVSTSA